VVVLARLAVAGPPVSGEARAGFEDEDYFGFRWWPAVGIARSADRFYPGHLPELLGPFLAGEEIDEPFERS
jgi:hypothetical protein